MVPKRGSRIIQLRDTLFSLLSQYLQQSLFHSKFWVWIFNSASEDIYEAIYMYFTAQNICGQVLPTWTDIL